MWNHRIIEFTDLNNNKYYSIREVFYDDNGIPRGYSTSPSSPFCMNEENLNDFNATLLLKKDCDLIQKALNKPILSSDVFKKNHEKSN